MKLGREVSRHNELDNWCNTHRFESVMATKWLLLTISEAEPGLWDRLLGRCIAEAALALALPLPWSLSLTFAFSKFVKKYLAV